MTDKDMWSLVGNLSALAALIFVVSSSRSSAPAIAYAYDPPPPPAGPLGLLGHASDPGDPVLDPTGGVYAEQLRLWRSGVGAFPVGAPPPPWAGLGIAQRPVGAYPTMTGPLLQPTDPSQPR